MQMKPFKAEPCGKRGALGSNNVADNYIGADTETNNKLKPLLFLNLNFFRVHTSIACNNYIQEAGQDRVM